MAAGPVIYGSQGNVNYPVAVRPQAAPNNLMLASMMGQQRDDGSRDSIALMMALLQMVQSQDARGEGARQFDASQQLAREQMQEVARTNLERAREFSASQDLAREMANNSAARDDARFAQSMDFQKTIQAASEKNQDAIQSINKQLADLQVAKGKQEQNAFTSLMNKQDTAEARSNVEQIIAPMALEKVAAAENNVADKRDERAIAQQTAQFRAPDVSAAGLEKLSRSVDQINTAFDVTGGWHETTKSLTDYAATIRRYVFDPNISPAERSMRAEAVMPDVDKAVSTIKDFKPNDTWFGLAKRAFGGESDRQSTQRFLGETADSFRREIRRAIKPGQEASTQIQERRQLRNEVADLAQKKAAAAATFREGRWSGASPQELERQSVEAFMSGLKQPTSQPAAVSVNPSTVHSAMPEQADYSPFYTPY